jgi:hypothetical protein
VTLLSEALALADSGKPVFPLKQNKCPLCEHGHKDATTATASIERAFANPLASLIGVPTGPASGFVVLDIDPRHGGDEWLREHCNGLPPTRIHRTRSGGLHFLFKDVPGLRNSAGRVAPGVDIRGDGGYIVWWPASGCEVYQDEPLVDCPPWLLDRIAAAKRAKPAFTGTAKEAPPRELVDQDLLKRKLYEMAQRLSEAPEGGKHAALCSESVLLGGYLYGLDWTADAAAAWLVDHLPSTVADRELARKTALSGLARGRLDPVPVGIAAAFWPPPTPINDLPEPKPAMPVKPTIRLRQGDIPGLVDEAESALVGACLGLYQRGPDIVQIGEAAEQGPDGKLRAGVRLLRVSERLLTEYFARAATWERKLAREQRVVACDPPLAIAQHYMARGGIASQLPILNGIIHAATLRRDGSLLDRPGYDPTTGLFLHLNRECAPSVPNRPSRDDAAIALNTLRDLICEFPFADPASEAVALSAILTAVVRPALDAAPAHAITATTYGSGKSYLTDLVATIATGETVAPIACGQTDEELEKRLAAELIAGKSLVMIDNVDREINGPLLAQAITQSKVNPRRLGKSENVEVPNTTFIILNGNNLAVPADMARRIVLCSLDAKVERPELRPFYKNPLRMVRRDRAQYVGAALTILRAYLTAEVPDRPAPIGSFEVWSDWVRGALLWLKVADPASSMETVRAADPTHQRLLAAMAQWNHFIGDSRVTVREIISVAIRPDAVDFREALLAVAGERGAINSARLGAWLRDNKGRIVGGLSFQHGPLRRGSITWLLEGARKADPSEIAMMAVSP